MAETLRARTVIIVLSPAKTLDFGSPAASWRTSRPTFLEQAAALIEHLRSKSPQQLGKLMNISPALASLNHNRYLQWQPEPPRDETRPALQAFKGDVYLGLEAHKFSPEDLAFARQHLRILSGLYGLLRPSDRILPHRLEMGTRLSNPRGKDLYHFWGTLISDSLVRDIRRQRASTLLNLASNEYFSALQPQRLPVPICSPIFKDYSKDSYRVISFYAKKARGMMASWVIRNRLSSAEQLEDFDVGGYRFARDDSTAEHPLFTRRQ